MEKVYIGKIVSTHGIKGEIRIISDFPYKNKVFKIGNKLIVDDKEYEIKTYRVHKNYDMVKLDEYNDINDVMFLMKKKVYFDKNNLSLDDNEILDEELINYEVLTTTNKRGIIKEIFLASPTNKILRVLFDKEVLIPINSPMIKEINKQEKKVIVELIEGI
ncbi:MAG: 16S rRNA processing protein RimM [Firmicutes bacterium]|nr:16S rRNA processing protein RimM [Bacillota bacterium]